MFQLDVSERDSRMLTALAMLTKQGDANAFETFRMILAECGHDSMAESLDFDRSRICWGKSAHSDRSLGQPLLLE